MNLAAESIGAAESNRPSAGLTTVRGAGSIGRTPARSSRVKKSSKLAHGPGLAASSSATP
jgi:hypothetical protein